MTNTNFTITLGSDDHEVLDDAVKRVLGLEDGQTTLDVTPIAALTDEATGRRIQRRRIKIVSTDNKIVARAAKVDFQKGVSVVAKNGR